MKKILGFTAAAFIATVSSVLAAEQVDFHAANPVLQSLVDAVISGDEEVDFAYPLFDESFSSIEKEKLKYDLQGSLKNTPWLDGGHATVVASTTLVADRTAGHVGLTTTARATTRTDVLAMLRYTGYLAKKKVESIEPKFEERVMAHLSRVAVVQSLDEYAPLLVSGLQLAKEMQQYQIDKRDAQLACLKDGSCTQGMTPETIASQIEYYTRAVVEERQILEGIGLIKVESRKEKDKTVEVTVSSDNLALLVPKTSRQEVQTKPGKSRGVFTTESITGMSEGFFGLEVAKLDKVKSKLSTRLLGVQNGNPDDKDEVQKGFRQALIEFKKVIHGKNEY